MKEFVQQLAPYELTPFAGHPFQVREDAIFEELTAFSLRCWCGQKGRGMSWSAPIGGALKLGLDTVPVLVREMDEYEAVVLMVGSNLQRENLLPCEKAFAYKMKLVTLKHQGWAALCQLGAVDKVPNFHCKNSYRA